MVLLGTLLLLNGCAAGETPAPEQSDTASSVSAVEPTFTPHASAAGIPDRFTSDGEKIALFSGESPSAFFAADGYSNGGVFNCTWRSANAKIGGGILNLSVSAEENGYAGAEYRTKEFSPYGFYSVCMKAADCSGVISSFFAYTNTPVWDEIDIEFLGKDTTHIQFNYYTNGIGGHEYYFDLGFDGAADFHEYAYDWQPDSITWYVDGKAVYRATEDIPSHPMQIMMNVWNCKGADGWSGVFDVNSLPATAQYKWIGFSSV